MATRPSVLVYQEYAKLGSTPAAPELDVCIVGPAYQIIDYPEDKTIAGRFGTLNAGTDVPVDPVVLPYVGLMNGAAVDRASVKVYAENARVRVLRGAAGVTTAAATTTVDIAQDAAAAGIQVGDYCILTDAGGHTLVRRVRSIAGSVITFTSQFPADGATWTNGAAIHFQFERDAGAGLVTTATPAAANVSVASGFQLGGLSVVSADLFLAYRALRTDLATVGALSDFTVASNGTLGNIGKVDARNPLAVGVSVAAKNTATPVQYFGVVSDDSAGYTAAKNAILARKGTYAVAVLASDYASVKEFGDGFLQVADPDYAITNGVSQKFLVAMGWAGALPSVKTLVARRTAASVAAGVLHDVGAGFVDAGVLPNDQVRFYLNDGTMDVRTVTTVTANEELAFSGAAPAVQAYDVVRPLASDKDGQVAALVARAKSCSNRRCLLMWPDEVVVTGLVDGSKARLANGTKAAADAQPGYFLAAAVAGMTAALPSHQGLTNFAINGISAVHHANPYFSDKQITALSNAGLFVFTQDDENSLPYIVHAVTTDPSTVEFGEYMCVKNMDYCSLALKSVLDDFIGKWNLTDETLGFIRTAEQAQLDTLMLEKKPRIGARIIKGAITQLGQSSLSEDRAEIFVECKFPKSLNTIGLHVVSN